MKHTSAAGWRLRQSNPVPDDAFGGAALDSVGQAAFERITASAASPQSGLDEDRRMRARPTGSRPFRSGRRLALRFAVPAIAAVATAAAVALSGVSAPRQITYTLDAFLAVHPAAHPGDAVAVLRRLAARAAAAPAPAFGPVEYSSNREWEDVGGKAPRDLYYFSHHPYAHQAWDALSGATAVRIVDVADGKVYTSYFPAPKGGDSEAVWDNPATLPASLPALRKHLLAPIASGASAPGWSATYIQHASGHPHDKGQRFQSGELPTRSILLTELRDTEKACQCAITNVRISKVGPYGYLTWQTFLVSTVTRFMSGEPQRPAVRSVMLRLLAQVAAHPGRGYTYVDMGTATDHLGRTGVVIGQEQANSGCRTCVGVQSLIFDPRTGALLDVADAQCEIPMGTIPRATGQCAPTDYTEFKVPRAVRAMPHYKAHNPRLYGQAGGIYM